MNVNQGAISMTRLKYRSARANSAAAVLRWSGSLATDPDAFAMDVLGCCSPSSDGREEPQPAGANAWGRGQKLCMAPALIMTRRQEKTLVT